MVCQVSKEIVTSYPDFAIRKTEEEKDNDVKTANMYLDMGHAWCWGLKGAVSQDINIHK